MAKILVADDDRKIRYLLVDILSDAGHEVIYVKDGGEAVEKTRQEHPDLILLDVSMPVMDGFEVAKRLKEIPDTRDIPVIMLTSLRAAEGELTAWRSGVKHYLSKPIDAGRVNLTVTVVLREAETAADEVTGGDAPISPERQTAIRTGSPQLDLILGGGLPLGSLTLIEGTPSSGKSVLCEPGRDLSRQSGRRLHPGLCIAPDLPRHHG